jgi:hypothetical protein
VPSDGTALTGRSSPSPAIIRAVTRWTNSGASAGTGGRMSAALVASGGTATSDRCSRALSTADQFFRTTASPRLP